MQPADPLQNTPAGEETLRRLFVYNGGFLTQKRLRRILHLSGYKVSLGLPGPDDMVGIWGYSPTAHRGIGIAAKRDTPLLNVEDAFLRSLRPGRSGEPPVGLFLDKHGPHFDPSIRSDLERLLTDHPLDDTPLLNRARACMARLKDAHLSKYSAFDLETPAPDPGYVLVIDQTQGDASVTASKANAAYFKEMLFMAQEENPGARILIKTHPETQQGFRPGYFSEEDCNGRISLCDAPISPWVLFDGAIGVYTLSSQMGFEAILTGHKPRVFGQPFYAGWGLTDDERPLDRRQRKLTRTQLFAAAMILYPTWYHPAEDRLCSLEEVIDHLEAQARAWREDQKGWNAHAVRLWKRAHFQAFFGAQKKLTFEKDQSDSPSMIWGNQPGPKGATRVEDGFLRSRGLGAELVPPLSLATDDLGIYYDPTRPSRLEHWIAKRETLRPDQEARADALRRKLVDLGLSKYNLAGAVPELPKGHRILVPGQVEDDASILTGTDKVRTNLDLLKAARQANPEAVIIFKPHPDVLAGLRIGAVENAEDHADVVLEHADMGALLQQVDEVWTMTSLTGFEALLRGCKITTLGAPFYAGWGLTTDLGTLPARRQAQPTLAGLIHATLIDYPRYCDPISKAPCSVEIAVERLAHGALPSPGPVNRLLAKAQGLLASYSGLWR
jgi:capsular polysaccharide export protein